MLAMPPWRQRVKIRGYDLPRHVRVGWDETLVHLVAVRHARSLVARLHAGKLGHGAGFREPRANGVPVASVTWSIAAAAPPGHSRGEV